MPKTHDNHEQVDRSPSRLRHPPDGPNDGYTHEQPDLVGLDRRDPATEPATSREGTRPDTAEHHTDGPHREDKAVEQLLEGTGDDQKADGGANQQQPRSEDTRGKKVAFGGGADRGDHDEGQDEQRGPHAQRLACSAARDHHERDQERHDVEGGLGNHHGVDAAGIVDAEAPGEQAHDREDPGHDRRASVTGQTTCGRPRRFWLPEWRRSPWSPALIEVTEVHHIEPPAPAESLV